MNLIIWQLLIANSSPPGKSDWDFLGRLVLSLKEEHTGILYLTILWAYFPTVVPSIAQKSKAMAQKPTWHLTRPQSGLTWLYLLKPSPQAQRSSEVTLSNKWIRGKQKEWALNEEWTGNGNTACFVTDSLRPVNLCSWYQTEGWG